MHPELVPAPVPLASVQGTLALDLDPRRDPPPVPTGRAGFAGRAEPSGADVIPIDRHRRRELERWAWRYSQAAVEIVGGDRPVSQLLRWTTRDVYDDLTRRAELWSPAPAGTVPARHRCSRCDRSSPG